jgi:hypothetical protein
MYIEREKGEDRNVTAIQNTKYRYYRLHRGHKHHVHADRRSWSGINRALLCPILDRKQQGSKLTSAPCQDYQHIAACFIGTKR